MVWRRIAFPDALIDGLSGKGLRTGWGYFCLFGIVYQSRSKPDRFHHAHRNTHCKPGKELEYRWGFYGFVLSVCANPYNLGKREIRNRQYFIPTETNGTQQFGRTLSGRPEWV